MKKGLHIILVMLLFAVVTVSPKRSIAADGGLSIEKANEVIESTLKDRTKLTGTLDLYDEKLNAVRNLRLIEMGKEVKYQPNGHIVNMMFRDTTRGDVLNIQANLNKETGTWAVADLTIGDVKKLEPKTDPSKTYTDADIRKAMVDYIESQAKFTGSLMLFDEENNKLRQLELMLLKDGMRKFGILNIGTAEFRDIESNQTVDVDITVQNKNGVLSVQRLKIKSIR